ncbi:MULTISPECIES: hypothetical protein [unclassified Micromonospora]|uniref:hypothetical protein n=1 Tax=unclassified Micromonospora TaxID=2617518 RepID=UPI001182A4CB|nr:MULTISPECIES: hypothetical protein [unclassified Micromonospora]
MTIRAYKIAKGQGRKALELEMLKDLLGELDALYKSTEHMSAPGPIPRPGVESRARILALDPSELDLWVQVYEYHPGDRTDDSPLEHHLVKKTLVKLDQPTHRTIKGYVLSAMHEQVVIAMKKRV